MFARLLPVNRRGLLVEPRRSEERSNIISERRIGDLGIADGIGPFCRLDQAVDVVEALPPRHFQAIEQTENDERGDALRRRWRIEERRIFEAKRQRLAQPRPVSGEIGSRNRSARRFEVGGNFDRDVSAIEILEAGATEVIERVGEPLLFERANQPREPCPRS